MTNPVVVYKGRTTVVTLNLGVDVSAETIVSEIRTDKDVESTLIAAWDVDFITDGTDGSCRLSLDDSVTSEIVYTNGYMDVKRISGGEPYAAFDGPLRVVFKDSVTE